MIGPLINDGDLITTGQHVKLIRKITFHQVHAAINTDLIALWSGFCSKSARAERVQTLSLNGAHIVFDFVL